MPERRKIRKFIVNEEDLDHRQMMKINLPFLLFDKRRRGRIFNKIFKTILWLFLALVLATPNLALSQPASRPMEVTVCTISHTDKDADERLELFKQMGVTSIQTYIFWNKVENEPGKLDWSEYDADAALFKKHGIKWVPFIIASPWYVTPEFVRRDPQMVMLRCLEHGRDSAIPSIWCPRLRDYVREYLRKFAEHYLPMDVLESINIGISGDYGEAIFSVLGNWPGEYHSHGGFWCGDALAAADFRRTVKELYKGDLQALNNAWKSKYATFDKVAPFRPETAASERAWLEFLRWYRDSMTAHADFWMSTAREYFPDTEIYLCTGGDMSPEHGSDFSAQAKIAAKYGGGIRITNESSSFPHNVRLTRMVGSACRFYGAYFGHEPASAVTPVGMLGRLFNAVASGARQLFLYHTPELIGLKEGKPMIGEGGRHHVSYRELQKTTTPAIDVGLFFPTPSSREAVREREAFGDLAADIRRFVDYDFLDDRLVQEGALVGKAVLVLAGASILESRTLAAIQAWVENGGVLFALSCRPLDWDGDPRAFDRLAGLSPDSDEIQGITELAVDAPKSLPSISSLESVFVTRAFAALSADAEPLLSMRYAPKGKVAWMRRLGKGRVYAYFGPMDLRPEEESWMVAHNLPMRFLRDGIQDCIGEGVLKKIPLSLNLAVPGVFLVETTESILVLNMNPISKKVDYPGGAFEIAGASILRLPKK
jgi:hypothetical protein